MPLFFCLYQNLKCAEAWVEVDEKNKMAKKSKPKNRKRLLLLLSLMFLCGVVCGGIIITQPRCRALLSRLVHKIERVLSRERRASEPMHYDDALYASMFNDRNSLHLSAARKVGLRRALKTRAEADDVKSELVKIESGDSYLIDNLTHSIPYLTSSAAQLLDTIGQSFTLSLRSKGIEPHRIIVTSVLRTQEDVRKLQSSGNVNASNNSAHSYATTFDITYVRYSKVGFRGRSASEQELFDTLVEVLQRFKNEGRCYVKYEIQQRCFHITSRQ
jgi:hypothetical protein